MPRAWRLFPFQLSNSRAPICHRVHGSCHKVLNQVIENDWHHDTRIGRQGQRRQNQTSPVVIHPQSVHERNPVSRSTLNRRLSPEPEAKAVTQRPVVIPRVTAKKSTSRSAIAWGRET